MSNQSQDNVVSGMSNSPAPAAALAKEQVQEVHTKLDKAQYFLDRAADIISDLRNDKDVAIIDKAYPWMRLAPNIELTEQRIDSLSDKTMQLMLKDLKKCGATNLPTTPTPTHESVRAEAMAQADEDDIASRYQTELFRNALSANPRNYPKGPDGYTSTIGIPFTTPHTPSQPSSLTRQGRIPTLAHAYMHRPSTPSNLSLGSKGTPIPMFKGDMDEKDKMMMEWKARGKSWADIKDQWEKMNGGHRVGNSTLPNRFVRLKAAFGEFDGWLQ